MSFLEMLQSYPTQLRPTRRVFRASNRGNATKNCETAVEALSDIARFRAEVFRISYATRALRITASDFSLICFAVS
jgi:hypothetical protein